MRSPLHPARRFLIRFARPHLILPVAFVNSATFTMIGLGLVFYLRDGFHATATTIGLASAFFSSLYFVGCFALRPLTTRLLPRYSLILASVLSAIGVVVVLSASSVTAVVVAYGFIGFSLALFWPPVMGWLSAGTDGQQLNREIARFNLAWSSGVIVGPLVAGLLTEIGLRLPLTVAVILLVVNASVIGFASIFVGTIRDDRYVEARVARSAAARTGTPLRFPAWVGGAAAHCTLTALIVTIPLFGRDALGFSETGIGAILLLRGLLASVTFIVLGSTGRWHFRPRWCVAPTVMLLLVTVGLVVIRGTGAFVALVALAGIAVATAYTSSAFHGAAGSVDRTRRMAIHEAMLTVGNVIGASIGGRLYQLHGIRGTLLFCGGVVGLTLIVQIAMLVRRPVGNLAGEGGPA